MDILLIIYLLVQPLLDISYTLNIFNINSIIRGSFILFIFIYLIRKKKYKESLITIISMFIYILVYLFIYKYNISDTLSLSLRLFYLPSILLFFYSYDEKINRKYFVYLLSLYLIIYFICLIFGIGNEIYESGIKKEGFKGLFNSINEFSAIVIMLLGISINYLQEKKKYILCIIYSLIVAILSMTLGTKVILGGVIIIFLYFLYKPFKDYFIKSDLKTKIFTILLLIVITFISSFIITNTTTYKNAVVQKKFFKVNNTLSLNYVNKVIFNNRFSFVKKNHIIYSNSNIINKLFGIDKYINRKTVEIDLFDLFYTYGIIGLIIILIYIIYIGYKSKLKNFYLFMFILLLLISETSGHVLISPAVSLYLGLIIYLNNKEFQ